MDNHRGIHIHIYYNYDINIHINNDINNFNYKYNDQIIINTTYDYYNQNIKICDRW